MSNVSKDEPKKLSTSKFYWPLRRYLNMYNRSIEDPDGFWAEQASILNWDQPWDKVLDWQPPYARWFVGGRLNASVQCVDRHAKSWRKNKVAIYWEGETGDTRTLSYADLYVEVNKFAGVLKKLGVKKGDRVTIYLPMIPELVFAMLACARIGAIHNVIFSGFSSQAIADRVNDSKSKLIITSNGGISPREDPELKEIVDEAVKICPTIEKVLLIKYTGHEITLNDRDVWFSDVAQEAEAYVVPESMAATDPLFILYTSGTTGKPKGILHGTAGYLLYATKTLQWAFVPRDESIYWCTADAGWITGHSYLVYAPFVPWFNLCDI